MSDFRLKVFQSVARNLSFTKSSQELFISQPAVTKHIHELEVKYSIQLFERRGSNISLTKAGELLLQHCESILNRYKIMDYEMNLLHNNVCGELRIGASTTIEQYVLPCILAKFMGKYPQIKLSLLNGNSREIEKAVEEHHVDLGVVEGIAQLPHLKYNSFLSDELVAVVSTKSRFTDKDEITKEELSKIPLALREQGSGTLDVFIQALAKLHINLMDLNILIQLGSTESIKSFLQYNNCMGILSIRSIQDELVSGKLRVIEIPEMSMIRHFHFVQQQGNESPLINIFKNNI